MEIKQYRIRKAFIIPLGLDAALLVFLTGLSYLSRSPLYERGLLSFISILTIFVFSEALERRVSVNGGLKIKKFLREKNLDWSDVTHVGSLSLRNRVYVLLTTKKGFHIISNAYENFGQLIKDIITRLPTDKIEVEEGVRLQSEDPTRNTSDLFAAWLAAIVLLSIIVFKMIS